MALELGTTNINKLYVGATEARRAYLGSTLVFAHPIVCDFLTSAVSGTDATGYTFPGLTLGAAATGRDIVVAIAARTSGATSGSVSSVTVGGIPATFVARRTSSDTITAVEIWIARVPTGTTGSIVVNWTETMLRCGVALWRSLNIASVTPTDTASDDANPMSATINVQTGGLVVLVSYENATATATLAGVSKNVDQQIEGIGHFAAGRSVYASKQTGLTVSATWTAASTTQDAMVAAAFR